MRRKYFYFFWGFLLVLSSTVAGSADEPTDWTEVEHEIDGWVVTSGPHLRNARAVVRVWWKSNNDEVTFRVEANTKGYVGLGFVRAHTKTDVIVGWVKNGEAVIQDRFQTSKRELSLDRQQNVELIAGFENETYTTLIFKRKHQTCDRESDVPILNDTTRIFYLAHSDDPNDSNETISYTRIWKGHTSVLLVPRPPSITSLPKAKRKRHVQMDLIIEQVSITSNERLHMCRLFKLPPSITTRHHVIGFEPKVQSGKKMALISILIYACHSNDTDEVDELDDIVLEGSYQCHQPDLPQVLSRCNSLFLIWTNGLKGMLLPDNVGLPLDPVKGPTHLYAEFQLNNDDQNEAVIVTGGLRLYASPTLRPNEGGLMSIGIIPNGNHMIPPNLPKVVSYGHCIGECTKLAFPPSGIHIFGTLPYLQTYGRGLILRHIRNGTELAPIVQDDYYDFEYQEMRSSLNNTLILPGDHLVAECTYNSEGRNYIILGGAPPMGETCIVYTYYFPKVGISNCQSVPTLQTVYAAMGVEEIWEQGKDGVPMIKKPDAKSNTSLASHISSYNWSKNLELYNKAIKMGSFEASCGNYHLQLQNSHFYPIINNRNQRNKLCPGEEELEVEEKSVGTIIIDNSTPKPIMEASVTKSKKKAKTNQTTTGNQMGSKSTSSTLKISASNVVSIFTILQIYYYFFIN